MGAAVIVIRVSSVCAFSLGLRVSIAGRRPVDSDEPWTDCRSSSVQLAPVATVRLTLGRSVGGGRETMPDGSHCLQAVGRVANWFPGRVSAPPRSNGFFSAPRRTRDGRRSGQAGSSVSANGYCCVSAIVACACSLIPVGLSAYGARSQWKWTLRVTLRLA